MSKGLSCSLDTQKIIPENARYLSFIHRVIILNRGSMLAFQ